MRVLIADDDSVTHRILSITLERWGHTVVSARDGREAWEILTSSNPPSLLILDWLMPNMDGVEICRKVRSLPELRCSHIILLTSRNSKEDVVKGLEAGADDYITKPFDVNELRARIQVGMRIINLQTELADRLKKLEEALAEVKTLHGLLPICSYCKKIRDDKNYWHQVESYVTLHANVRFSHSVCPDCLKRLQREIGLI